MATIAIFASSLFIASAMVAVKGIELKYGRKNFILEIFGKLDSKSMKLIASAKFRTLQLVQSVRYVLLVQSKIILKHLLEKAEEKIVNEYKKRQDAIMTGKRDIINKGAVSFYLKKIAENKGAGARGKIEESL